MENPTRELQAPKQPEIHEHKEIKKHVEGLYRGLTSLTSYIDLEPDEFADRMRMFIERLHDEKLLHDELFRPNSARLNPEETDNDLLEVQRIMGDKFQAIAPHIVGIDPNDPDLTMEQKLDLYMRSHWR